MEKLSTRWRPSIARVLLHAACLFWSQVAGAQFPGIREVTRLGRPDIPGTNYSDAAVAIDGARALLCPSLRFGGSGSCLVFQRPAGAIGGWYFVTEIVSPQPNAWDEFGSAADLVGDTAIAGLPGGDAAGFNAGAASIHHRQAGGTDNWGFERNLYASDPAPEHVFSRAVAFSGDTLVVGAPTINLADFGVGSAYVFERDAGGPDNWGLVKRLSASDAPLFGNFGFSVAILGERIAIGAPGVDSDTGAAYLFERNFGGASNWGEVARVVASDGIAADRFGSSVALAPGVLAVGAPRRDEAGLNTGAVYLFGTTSWVEQQKFIGTEQDGLGTALAFGDGLLAAGAPGNLGPLLLPGAVALFSRSVSNSGWSLAARLHAPGVIEFDGFGSSVDMDGGELIVGAPIQGSAYVFVFGSSVVEVPALAPLGLGILGILLAVLGVLLVRRRCSELSRHGS